MKSCARAPTSSEEVVALRNMGRRALQLLQRTQGAPHQQGNQQKAQPNTHCADGDKLQSERANLIIDRRNVLNDIDYAAESLKVVGKSIGQSCVAAHDQELTPVYRTGIAPGRVPVTRRQILAGIEGEGRIDGFAGEHQHGLTVGVLSKAVFHQRAGRRLAVLILVIILQHVVEGAHQRLLLLLGILIGEMQNLVSGLRDEKDCARAYDQHKHQAAQQGYFFPELHFRRSSSR